MRRLIAAVALVILVMAAAPVASSSTAHASVSPPPGAHVFVIVLENKNFEETFGPDSPASYLNGTLLPQGKLLSEYYATGHFSLDNYISLISGQPPNAQTQADCQFYNDWAGTHEANPVGQGCVYPTEAKTIADQLEAKGRTWKGYMEDMGDDPARDNGTNCAHPDLNAHDTTQTAAANDQYATRHNPFVYFHSIIDDDAKCKANVVPLKNLPNDLANESTTANLTFITPDLCSDGHDTNCADGRPGGLQSIDAFLKEWVPMIIGSPAFGRDGILVVTYDEAEATGGAQDSKACCNEQSGPNTPAAGQTGPGGGRTGAVILSQFVKPGTVNDTPYNHYSFLRSLEDLYGVGHLGMAAADGLKPFGSDVFDNDLPVSPNPPTSLTFNKQGYRLFASDGGVFTYGSAPFEGSAGGIKLNQPIVGGAATQNGDGYWLVARDGGLFNYGDAAFAGSLGGQVLNQPIVGMARTKSGNGYWLVAADGGVFAFGDAAFSGSLGAQHLNQPIVGISASRTGEGYYLVARDGGVFAFGDATFDGSMGGSHLNQPIVGMAADPTSDGYWLVARDGGIFTFGKAGFGGSLGAQHLNQPIVGITPTASGNGYLLTAADGGVFTFGFATFEGSAGGAPLNAPVVAIA